MISRRKIVSLLLFPLLLIRCGGTVIPIDPVQEIRKTFAPNRSYTLILKDMDLRNDQYFHKYDLFEVAADSTVKITTTEWKKVSDEFFLLHENNLGMELVSQMKDGNINGLITPPGFTNFVGNETYGSWVPVYTDTLNVLSYSDSTIWQFNSQFSHLEKKLGLTGLDVTQREYEEFQQNYLFNRPYYGDKTVTDSTKYGTRSSHFYGMYPWFYARRAQKRNFNKPHTSSTSSGSRGGGGFGK